MSTVGADIQLNQASDVDERGNDTKGVVTARDVDEALVFLNDDAGVAESVHINEKKLIRKVDLMLMPLMFACYYLQYTDKTLLSYSGIMGIQADTNMPDNGFSNLSIAFYVSFFFFEPIQSVLLQYFPTAKWLGANVICWGIVLTLNCVCHNYASLIALRVLLGIFESVTAPSLVILTSMWYKRHEQTSRMGWWYQGSSVGPAVSSLVSYGFGHWTASDPTISFKSWQVLFLVFGLITIIFGILTFLFLPDSPFKSRLTHEEKLFIIERVRENQTGIENKHFKWSQFKEVIFDVRTWLLSLIVILTNVPNGAVSSFSSIIIENFGYDEYQSLLLNLPGCAVAFISVWAGAYWAGRFNARGIAIVALIIPTLIGGALLAWLPADNKGGLLSGSFLINTVGSTLPLLYSWITANFAGHSKKITMNAIVLMSFCVGNIIGPETFQDKDGPHYIPAKITIVVTLSFAIVLTVILDLLYLRENRKRSTEEVQDLPHNHEFMDLTDKQNRTFKYLL